MKPKKRERKPKLSFAARLEQKLAGVFGTVDVGRCSDNSGSWVSLRRGGKQVNFTFDASGNKLEDVGVFEDVVQVVDERKIF